MMILQQGTTALHMIDSAKLPQSVRFGVARRLVNNARPEDIMEWCDGLGLQRQSPAMAQKHAVERAVDTSLANAAHGCLFVYDGSVPVAVLGVSGNGWLWSFWARPRARVIKNMLKVWPLAMDIIFRHYGFKSLRNYIHKDNTFFQRLLSEKSGATITPLDGDYSFFEVTQHVL